LILRVIGKKYKEDGYNYMQKIWIGELNNISLPFKEEYFIDNTVVSKSTYFYMKVNEEISDSIFDIDSLPELKAANDGVVPKYVNEYKDAQALLDFKLKLPGKMPEGFVPSEIAVIPPAANPKFYCMYYNSKGRRIYLNEGTEVVSYDPKYLIGDINCEVRVTESNILITWKQDNVYININCCMTEYDSAVLLAESIAKSRLVKK
jgi:hypothetical protein